MAIYWTKRPRAPLVDNSAVDTNEQPTQDLSDYDLYRQTLITDDNDEGWESELRRYLKEIPAHVSKDTDIVEHWSVSFSDIFLSITS